MNMPTREDDSCGVTIVYLCELISEVRKNIMFILIQIIVKNSNKAPGRSFVLYSLGVLHIKYEKCALIINMSNFLVVEAVLVFYHK